MSVIISGRVLQVICILLAVTFLGTGHGKAEEAAVRILPGNGTVGVNPDTHLVLTFSTPPKLGTAGQIRVYETSTERLVDSLDISIPAGPDATWRGQTRPADAPEGPYQTTTIGGMAGFHFHPVIIHGNVATIYLHNNRLQYDRIYRVEIDPGVFAGFAGFQSERAWTFTVKRRPPREDASPIVVAADGSGDFNTVQGAVDFVPNKPKRRVTIFIKNGNYEEIVYFRGKSNLTIRGEDREKVRVGYGNSSLFNPPSTPRVARDAFTIEDSTGIHLVNFTISNYLSGQAGALYISGDQNILSKMNLLRSGDTLQTHGRLYVADSRIVGEGDTIIGTGPLFCDRCEISSWGSFVWPRNTHGNHGYVFVNSTFDAPASPSPLGPLAGPPLLARSPRNNGIDYLYAEVVLIDCRVQGILPVGWGTMASDAANLRLWEYNTRNISDKQATDVSLRSPASRQLTLPDDAQLIASYSNPAYVLGGWKPATVR